MDSLADAATLDAEQRQVMGGERCPSCRQRREDGWNVPIPNTIKQYRCCQDPFHARAEEATRDEA